MQKTSIFAYLSDCVMVYQYMYLDLEIRVNMPSFINVYCTITVYLNYAAIRNFNIWIFRIKILFQLFTFHLQSLDQSVKFCRKNTLTLTENERKNIDVSRYNIETHLVITDEIQILQSITS